MDLNKKITTESSLPHEIDKGIVCLNFNDTNFVYNFPTSFVENRKQEYENECIGVWKPKQLKK